MHACIYMHACMHACMHMRACICMHAYASHAYMHGCRALVLGPHIMGPGLGRAYACMCLCIHAYACICMHMYAHVCTTCMRVLQTSRTTLHEKGPRNLVPLGGHEPCTIWGREAAARNLAPNGGHEPCTKGSRATLYQNLVPFGPSNLVPTLYHSAPCLLYTSPSPRDQRGSRMPSSA